MARLQDLIDERSKAWETVTEIRDRLTRENRDANPDEDSTFRQAMDQVENLGKLIANEERLARLEAVNYISADGVRGASLPPLTRDGTPLLQPEQRMADWRSCRAADQTEDGVRLGALLRTWVTGRREHLNDSEQRAMSEGTATAGGHMVPTPTAARFIDRARNAARVMQAGATTVPMDTQTLKVPRLTGSSAPAWRNENATVADGDLTMDAVTLNAKSLAFLVRTSRELVEDANPAILGVVEQDLAAQVALEIDRVALRGTGTAPEPRGVRNTSGVTVTAFGGANGATPTSYDHLIDAEQAVRALNYEPTAHIQSSRSEGTLRKLKETTTDAYLQPPPDLKPRLITNQIPGNLTTGTSTDTTEVYTGQWPMLYVGMRTGPLIFQLVERYADVGQIALLVWVRADVALAQPGAFTVTTGVRP